MKNEFNEWLKERIKLLLDQHKIHKDKMADYLNMKKKSFYAYLDGRAQPSLTTTQKFCQILGITMDEFMKGSPVPKPDVQTN